MTTERQKAAVNFCEEVLNVNFKGDINNFNEVFNFLSIYLDAAKVVADDARESYNCEFV